MKFFFLTFVLMFSEVAIPAAERSIVLEVRMDMAGGLKTALDHFAIDCGRYPTTSEGFAGMVNCPTNFSGGKWSGPYLDAIPIDPWGNAYVYHCPGIHNTNGYDLYSCGFDGISKSGGEDLDDINNWDTSSPHGGHDGYLNYFQLFMVKFGGIFWFPSAIILFLGGVRMIAAIFSQRVRDSIARHPIAHLVWLVVSLAAFVIFIYGFPRVAG